MYYTHLHIQISSFIIITHIFFYHCCNLLQYVPFCLFTEVQGPIEEQVLHTLFYDGWLPGFEIGCKILPQVFFFFQGKIISLLLHLQISKSSEQGMVWYGNTSITHGIITRFVQFHQLLISRITGSGGSKYSATDFKWYARCW